MKTLLNKLSLAVIVLGSSFGLQAAQAPQTARSMSPHDLTGYWVALVTEDWRFRMVTAPVGDSEGITLTAAGEALANSWDPDADTASGAACKAYGAGGLMRMPTRLHITWADENVLKLESDAGKQTRMFKFGSAQDDIGAGSLQGISKARWDLQRTGRSGPVENGTLEVSTTQMASGYVRRNGVPYSDQASLTEYFELVEGKDGTEYLVVIAELKDPVYLGQSVLTSTNFKREKDASGWAPTECVAK